VRERLLSPNIIQIAEARNPDDEGAGPLRILGAWRLLTSPAQGRIRNGGLGRLVRRHDTPESTVTKFARPRSNLNLPSLPQSLKAFPAEI